MSPYTITITIYDDKHRLRLDKTKTKGWHYANGAAWSTPPIQQGQWDANPYDPEAKYTLTMGGSGTSGVLRFVCKNGSAFMVAVGVHNWKRWCHIVTDLSSSDTTSTILPTYYGGSRDENLWKQRDHISRTDSNGSKYKLEFTQKTGHNLTADLFVDI